MLRSNIAEMVVICMVFIICLLVGMITAFVGRMLGLGGGIIFILTMLFLADQFTAFEWAKPQTIVGLSLVAMIFTAMSSTISYTKKGRVDFRTGAILLLGSIPGGILGAWINQFVNTDQFNLYFGLFVIGLAILMFVKREPKTDQSSSPNERNIRRFVVDGEVHEYSISVPFAFAISVIVGTVSGLFGIGGGSIVVPALILLFYVPPHVATATSMFMILVTSFFGSLTHIYLGHIIWSYALFFIPGAWMGGFLGAKVNQLLKGSILKWLLRIILVVIGIRLILEGIS